MPNPVRLPAALDRSARAPSARPRPVAACALLALTLLALTGCSERPAAAPNVVLVVADDLDPVSYTHLTLPTNREV